jgi:hypothetical protein
MFSSLNYEKKYLKYKNKYQILKNQYDSTKNILSGGECIPLPNPEEEDFLAQNLLDLCPNERITIQNKCYDIRSLYELVIKRGNTMLPGTITRITEAEKEKLKKEYKLLLQAYQRLNDCNPLPTPWEIDILTSQNLFNLHPSERITIRNRCYAVRPLYQWIFIYNINTLPSTDTLLTDEEIERIRQAYQAIS